MGWYNSSTGWYDKVAAQIEQDHTDGLIDDKEYHRQIRELSSEYEQEAQLAAEETYNSFY